MLGSVEPTAITCRMGVIIIHRTPRLFSLAGVTKALPLSSLIRGTQNESQDEALW